MAIRDLGLALVSVYACVRVLPSKSRQRKVYLFEHPTHQENQVKR